MWRRNIALTGFVCLFSAVHADASDDPVSTEPTPLASPESFPDRPAPIVELGERFLGLGNVVDGILLPTGAVWQPAFLIFGTLRSALQDDGTSATETAEWANRLDLFANLRLTGTERVLFGIRPLDSAGQRTGYQFGDGPDSSWQLPGAPRLQTLFFEGDFGELFPRLDIGDRHRLDLGIAVGRQPLFFQEGMLLDDSVDSIGLARNTLRPRDTSNFRVTTVFGWGDVHRAHGLDPDASLLGLLTQLDKRHSTIDFDLVLVRSGQDAGDSLHLGVSAVQRLGRVSTAFRVLQSQPLHAATTAAGSGTLLFSELSFTPGTGPNLVYGNGFLAVDEYTPAARDPRLGGPLARTGILFSAASVGRYSSALSNDAENAGGAALGYQMFFRDGRAQLIVEAGIRYDWAPVATTAAVGARVQHAIGRRFLLRLDGFQSAGENGASRTGFRLELVSKF